MRQDEFALHVYRLTADWSWSFAAVGGEDAVLHLSGVGIEIPLAEIYEFTSPRQEPDENRGQSGIVILTLRLVGASVVANAAKQFLEARTSPAGDCLLRLQ